MKKNIFVYFDIDGALFSAKFLHEEYPLESVIQSNQDFFDHILELAETASKEKYEQVVFQFGISSIRQNPNTDYFNGEKTGRYSGSGILQLEPIVEEFNKRCTQKNIKNIESKLDKFLLGDLKKLNLSNSEEGETYEYIKKVTYKDKYDRYRYKYNVSLIDNYYNNVLSDRLKIVLLYCLLQRTQLVTKDNDAPSDFYFYEDSDEILNALSAFFKENNSLIPKNILFNMINYKNCKYINNFDVIKGTGTFCTTYKDLTYFILSEKDIDKKFEKYTNLLKQEHEKRRLKIEKQEEKSHQEKQKKQQLELENKMQKQIAQKEEKQHNAENIEIFNYDIDIDQVNILMNSKKNYSSSNFFYIKDDTFCTNFDNERQKVFLSEFK